MDGFFDEEKERIELARAEFLDDKGLTSGDVMQDSLGREYVIEIDHETGLKEKVYLPE